MLLFLVFLPFFVLHAANCEHTYISRSELPEFAFMNTSVDPCDDFYEYSCGNFKNVHPRPERYPVWDNFVILQEKIHSLFGVILSGRNRDGDPESVRKARAAYSACVNVEYADNLEYPELGVLKEKGPWPLINKTTAKFSWEQMGDVVAEHGVQFYVRADVIENLLNVSEYVIMLNRDTVLNPSIIPPYEDNSVDFLKYETISKSEHPFQFFLLRLAIILRDATGGNKSTLEMRTEVAQIFEFMKKVQQGGTNTGGNSNVAGFHTVKTLQEWVDVSFPQSNNINFLAYLKRVFAKSGVTIGLETKVLVSSMSWLYGILDLMSNTSDEMLRNFVFTRLFSYTAPDSNNEVREAYNQFREDMGDIVYDRSEYCTRYVLGYQSGIALSMAATYEYQRYYFNQQKLESVVDVLKNLHQAFIGILDKSEWMDEPSRIKAKEKASKMITLLGYPDYVEHGEQVDVYYFNVRVCLWDHFNNAQRLRAFNMALNFALLDKPRDKENWNHSPLVVNAFYNSQNNRILLPISILNSVFYEGRHSVTDYARLGAIIGHEITHGFDNQGSQYDGDGNLWEGWSAASKEQFKIREECFREQYGGYFIEETGKYINANVTMRENLADNGGLREAFLAFKQLSVSSSRSYTPEQLFFISYGTMWCSQETPQHLERASNRGYSPSRFRVIGSVSNNADFAEAFKCAAGSNMNPHKKCILW